MYPWFSCAAYRSYLDSAAVFSVTFSSTFIPNKKALILKSTIMPEQSTLHRDQFFQNHTTPARRPSKTQRLTNVQAAQAPSPQRSPSYSPPPVAIPTAPKAMMYPAHATAVPSAAKASLTKTHEGRYSSHLKETQHSSPVVAPKIKHRGNAQQKQGQQTERCEEKSLAHTTCQQTIHPIEMCDNYGCNGFHNHDDCPLEKRCWGCRSPNHFWSDCPVSYTCCSCFFSQLICESRGMSQGPLGVTQKWQPLLFEDTLTPMLSR